MNVTLILMIFARFVSRSNAEFFLDQMHIHGDAPDMAFPLCTVPLSIDDRALLPLLHIHLTRLGANNLTTLFWKKFLILLVRFSQSFFS